MMKKILKVCSKEKLFLVLILILAGALRLVSLDRVPVGLFGDELDIGYQAFSLWKTGRDYMGNKLPVYLHSFYEYRMPMLVYLTVPIVGFFGLSEWTVRLIPSLFGLVNILLFWSLLKTISKNKKLPLVGALLMTIVPWHIHYSRIGFDVTVMMAFILGSLILYFKTFVPLQKTNNRAPRNLYLASLILPLAFYTYSASLFFCLMFIPVVILLTRKRLRKINHRHIAISGALLLAVCIPMVISIFEGKASSRFAGINISNDPILIDEIHFKRGQDGGGGRIFHNKVVSYSRSFIDNYLTAFSPQFLFISGDPNFRHSPGEFGVLLFSFLPFLIIGLWASFYQKTKVRDSEAWVFLAWLLLAPVSASLTIDGGVHATRLFLMLPPLLYFISRGAVYFSEKLPKFIKVLSLFIILGVMVVEMALYLHQYYSHYPRESWQFFNYGYKEIMEEIKDRHSDYDLVFINAKHDPPLTAFLFWNEIDPVWFQENYRDQEWEENIVPNYKGFRLGKFIFGSAMTTDFKDLINEKTLYVAFQEDEIPGDWNWEKSPPVGIKSIRLIYEPISHTPYMYLLTGDEKKN